MLAVHGVVDILREVKHAVPWNLRDSDLSENGTPTLILLLMS